MTERTPGSESTETEFDPPRPESVARTIRECTAFLEDAVEEAGADGAVVNLSGGIDSTVTATLAAEALGSDRVLGLVLPAAANRKPNIDDARQVAEELVIDYRVVDVQPILERFVDVVLPGPVDGGTSPIDRDPDDEHDRKAIGNATARLRAAVAYFEANRSNRLVVGTGNRTELLLGYFTKYGDGAADLLPIGDLYKTEVRALARHMDVRDPIVEKEPTAGLWEGQTDASELGATYETIDTVLYHAVERDLSIEEIAAGTGLEPGLVETFLGMYRDTAHKRRTPPTPST